MTNARLLAMAKHNRPPQRWYDAPEEELFVSEPFPLPPYIAPKGASDTSSEVGIYTASSREGDISAADFDAMPLPQRDSRTHPTCQPPAWAILTPRKGALALCSKKMLGLITSDKPVPTKFGTDAWSGIHLTGEVGSPWCSRNPLVVGYVDTIGRCHECRRVLSTCAACDRGEVEPHIPNGWAEGGE